MTRKILEKASPGVAGVTFGSDDIDYINKLLTGTDQSATDPIDINTTWKFRNSKARIQGASTQVSILATEAATSDKTVTLPDATGRVSLENNTATLTNKTISGASNTITNIAKAALPGSVLHNDQNNTLGAFYLDVAEIAEPSNPGADILRIFANGTTGELSVRKPGGTTVSLEASGGGGAWDPAAAETLTNKTIAFASNTLTGVASLTTSQTLTGKTITFADNTLTNVASLNTAQTFITAAKTFNSSLLK